MDRDTLNRFLEGGAIEGYDFDMRRNRLAMSIHVLENSKLSTYDLRFEKISQFIFDTESKSNAGDRLEVTEIWIDVHPEASPSEEWDVTISVFDMTHLRIRCSVIFVDEVLLR